MRKFLALAAVTMMTATGAMAQKSQPAGMRVGKSLFFDHHDGETTKMFMGWR